MFYGLSGLKSHQTRIDVIGNNVANINTAGFKKSRVTFKENLNQLINPGIPPAGERGSINPEQIGYGTRLGSIDVIHTEGNIQLTGNPTDLAIKGDGFFILKSSGDTADLTGQEYVYTRAGNFGIDPSGDLIYKPNGLKIQGWRADSNGEVNTAGNLMGLSMRYDQDGNQLFSTPRETTRVDFGGNLNSRSGEAELIDEGGTGLTEVINLRKESTLTEPGLYRIKIQDGGQTAVLTSEGGEVLSEAVNISEPGTDFKFVDNDTGDELLRVSFNRDELSDGTARIDIAPRRSTTSIGIYDSKGNKHTLEMTAIKGNEDNVWEYEVTTASVGDKILEGTVAEENISQFENVDGNKVTEEITFEPTGILQSGNRDKYITVKPAGGANLINVKLDLIEVTQFADDSDLSAVDQNGIGPGQLESFQISASGDIIGIYSNGVSQLVGKVALADVPNPGGLAKFQDTMFLEAASSGTVLPKTAGKFGLGSISSGSLELSNVNLSDEFTDLITSERGFQANSRVITTADEVLVEALNLKR